MSSWRDTGGGRVKCDDSGRMGTLVPGHHVVVDGQDNRTVTFTRAEWAKLEALAAKRSTPKRPWTARQCIRDFVKRCQP